MRKPNFLVLISILTFISGTLFAWLWLSFLPTGSSSNSITFQASKSKCELIGTPKIPDGKELEFRAERRNDNLYLIRIKNVSNHKVFIPIYTITDKSDVVLPYITEKRNQNGEFITIFAGQSNTSQLTPVEINQEITFSFYSTQKGEYRLKFWYLVDEDLVHILNDSNCPFKFTDSGEKQPTEAWFQVTISPFEINKNLPYKRY